MVAVDQPSELLGHRFNELLLVFFIPPELSEDVVLPAGVFHPEKTGKEKLDQWLSTYEIQGGLKCG